MTTTWDTPTGGRASFRLELAQRLAEEAEELVRAQARGDLLLVQICLARIDDLRAVAARNDLALG